MATLKGDYIGFTYNDVHSSELGIFRVSDGSRFNESLLPTSQDKTVQKPGGEGTYFFGSHFTNKVINLQFAFDSLTEEQLRRIKEVFGDKKIHYLIFDELPYKKYEAKVTGNSTIKFLPFSEGPTNRVYKGEGSLTFTCYSPYAVCTEKYLENYDQENKFEWKDSTGMLQDQGEEGFDVLNIDSYNPSSGHILLHNPGVKATDWRLTIYAKEDGSFPSVHLTLGDESLMFTECEAKEGDEYLIFNSKTRLIEGYTPAKYEEERITEYRKSGFIYNEFLQSGDFFDIPCGTELKLDIKTSANKLEDVFGKFDYYYYYF